MKSVEQYLSTLKPGDPMRLKNLSYPARFVSWDGEFVRIELDVDITASEDEIEIPTATDGEKEESKS